MFCAQCGKPANDAQKFCASCGATLGQSAATSGHAAYAPLDANSVYAPLGHRLLAYLIDYAVFVGATLLAVMIAGATGRPSGAVLALGLWVVGLWLYKAGMESSKYQATLGKLALNLQVTTEDGRRLSFAHATGRWVAFLVSCSITLISFLIAAFTDRRQSLHDLFASTLVVRKGHTSEEIATAPAASGGAGVVVLVIVVVFVGIFFIGILAAIAIPAYQDYTIRAQISQGMAAAMPIEEQVAQAIGNGVDLRSATTQSLGINSAASGRYVQGVGLDFGAIVITFGGAANPLIQGHKLVLHPVKISADSIAWACGYREIEGTRLDAANLETASTDIPEKFLPQFCRR
jgi:uncharacterized RDD family membrane protein YckC